MGREIRRVPKNWKLMFDQDYEEACKEWWESACEYHSLPLEERKDYPWYWDYSGEPPDINYYHPKWTEDPTCYQMYETVSEGTPVSPVFETLDELEDWLIKQGYSEEAASSFIKMGWCPSFMFTNGRIYQNIETCDPKFLKKGQENEEG